MNKKKFSYKSVISIILGIYSLTFIFPLLLLFSISFSKETDIIKYGFALIPKTFTITAYEFAFRNGSQLLSAFIVTALYASVCTVISILIMSMTGYALSCENFAYKKFMNVFLLITMFISGGIVPAYIINTQYYGLQNNPLIYLIGGGMVSAYTVFIFRTFFNQLPKELIESAGLDGATDMQVLIKVIIPLSKPVIITYGLFGLIARWNDYETCLYYVTEPKLYTLQYLLQQVLKDADMIKQSMQIVPGGMSMASEIPSETLKFAICVISLIPMLAAFPFFQKYFSKGMMVGSVKG